MFMATIDKAKGQAVEEHSLSSFDKKRGRWLPTPHRNIKNIVLFRFRKWREPIFTDISEKLPKSQRAPHKRPNAPKLCGKFFTARIAITIAIGKEKKRVKHRKIRSIAVFSQTPKTQFQYLRQLLPKWRRE